MGRLFHEQVLPVAIREGLLGETRPVAAFLDTDGVRRTVRALQSAFPAHFRHAFAAKANPMSRALSLVREAGMACEVASAGEFEQALRSGFEPAEIVFDQPTKPVSVLEQLLRTGVGLNIDNFQEFERVQAIVNAVGSSSQIGFRINPQVGGGAIPATSTATGSSKFGVALEDPGNREALVQCYRDNAWLTALHCHVGSQGCSLEMMTAGVRKLVDLANDINSACGRRQVELIDIGGGLPVNFESEEVRPTFAEYAAVLKQAVPELFSGEYRAKTEFGRSIFAKHGLIAARVEYTKESAGRHIALTHAGAQVATRTVFMPEYWKLRVSVVDASGNPRSGKTRPQDVAGPLCFAGDVVAWERQLPLIEAGDYVVLHDTGAYYFSNPFYYNALPACAVYGVENGCGPDMSLSLWRQQQNVGELLSVIG